jgi:Calx-beta domain
MRRLKFYYRWVAVLTLAIALAPSTAPAQEADTLSISGTFSMDQSNGTVGADLAAGFARDNQHGWSLTVHGITYSHDYSYFEWIDEFGYGYSEEFVTHVHATSFDFELFGPDADVLNEAVSQQLVRGSLTNGAFLDLRNVYYYDAIDPWGGGQYATFSLGLWPLDPDAGVSFYIGGTLQSPLFPTGETGYPAIEPRRVTAATISISDLRPGNSGWLTSIGDPVDIGSSEPPVIPPTLSIADGSMREGNSGTTRLELTVTLSRSSTNVVTVKYQTANGTALATKDYSSVTNGTLTFQPGQTSGKISISIMTDRKPEPNETFSVQLSGAVGATIADAVATASILNDDGTKQK